MSRQTSEDISHLSLVELNTAFREGRLSPVEVAQASLERAAQRKDLNVFVVEAKPDAVLAQARESEARWKSGKPLGPIDGVPITVKDAIITEDWPTLVGSKTIDPAKSLREDAPPVARMREQGVILLGKTTTPEFGWKAVTDSPLTGITRSPWNPAMTPGGSSGGSAAALAAGIGHAAIGTDAGGSVRIPASFCGLVAIKATRGRIPVYPPSALWTLGHNGPMCRTVSDTSLMMSLMTKPDPRDWNGAPVDPAFEKWDDLAMPLKGLRIAYSPTFGYAKVQPEVQASVEAAAQVFRSLGASVDLVEKPFKDPTLPMKVLFAAGIAHSVRKLSATQRDLIDPGVQPMIAFGEGVDRTAFMEASEVSITLAREMRLFHEKYPLLLSPTVAVAPFAVGTLSPEGYDPEDWLSWSPFTYPFNMTGQPAMSIPCGLTSDGLPIGLQLVGVHYAEKMLLRAAYAFEQANPTPVGFPAN